MPRIAQNKLDALNQAHWLLRILAEMNLSANEAAELTIALDPREIEMLTNAGIFTPQERSEISSGSEELDRNDALWLNLRIAQAKCESQLKGYPEIPDLSFIDNVISDFPDKAIPLEPSEAVKKEATLSSELNPLEIIMFKLLNDIAIENDSSRENGRLPVMESMLCLKDKIRTKKFLLAIKDAVKKLEQGKEEIFVMDAGCGAIPIMGIYAAMNSKKVKCTCIEINPNACNIAREIIKKLGLEDQIEVIMKDAITYKPEKELDLLISETMSGGLGNEMMVDILRNLSSSVKKDGIILPKSVNLKAALLPKKDFKYDKAVVISKYALPLLNANWEDVLTYKSGQNLEEISYSFDSNDLKPGEYVVLLLTEVDLETHLLRKDESLISYPNPIEDLNIEKESQIVTLTQEDIDSGRKISFRYKPGEQLKGLVKIV